MIRQRFIFITILSLVTCFGLVQWLVAQTWTDPTSAPPISTIPKLSDLGGDNLGNHIAQFDLNMGGYPIEYIGTVSGGSTPAISVRATQGGLGLYATSSSIGLYAEGSVSIASGMGVVGAFNHNSATIDSYALEAQSIGGQVSARLYGTTVLQSVAINSGPEAQLQFGTDVANSLSVVAGSVEGRSLYYGSSLLCDPTKVDCGFAPSTFNSDDNLGSSDPHVATKNLNLNGNRIINVVANTSANRTVAYQTGPLPGAPGVLVRNTGGSHLGLPTALYGTTLANSDGVAGIYGYHSWTGAGIMAASASGTAAEIHGQFNTMMNNSNGVGDQYISFGPMSGTNKLRAAPTATGLTVANKHLYWGDMPLCDRTSVTCGWQTAGPGPIVSDQWELQNQTLYYQASNPNVNNPLRTNVGIAIGDPDNNLKYQLMVRGLSRSTGGYLGSLLVTDVIVDNILDIGTDLWIGGNVTLTGVAGVQVDGDIAVSATGINIGGTNLTAADLQKLIAACNTDGGGC